jgi:hypothetical protein
MILEALRRGRRIKEEMEQFHSYMLTSSTVPLGLI